MELEVFISQTQEAEEEWIIQVVEEFPTLEGECCQIQVEGAVKIHFGLMLDSILALLCLDVRD